MIGRQGSNLPGPFAAFRTRRFTRRLRGIPPRGRLPTEEKMKQRELCLDKAIYPAPARKRNFTRFACYALFGRQWHWSRCEHGPIPATENALFPGSLSRRRSGGISGRSDDFDNAKVFVSNVLNGTVTWIDVSPDSETVNITDRLGIQAPYGPCRARVGSSQTLLRQRGGCSLRRLDGRQCDFQDSACRHRRSIVRNRQARLH
jgi:hypothetical protein